MQTIHTKMQKYTKLNNHCAMKLREEWPVQLPGSLVSVFCELWCSCIPVFSVVELIPVQHAQLSLAEILASCIFVTSSSVLGACVLVCVCVCVHACVCVCVHVCVCACTLRVL